MVIMVWDVHQMAILCASVSTDLHPHLLFQILVHKYSPNIKYNVKKRKRSSKKRSRGTRKKMPWAGWAKLAKRQSCTTMKCKCGKNAF